MRVLYFVFVMGVLTGNIYADDGDDGDTTIVTTEVTTADTSAAPADATTTAAEDSNTTPADVPSTVTSDGSATTQSANTHAPTTPKDVNAGSTVKVTTVTGQTTVAPAGTVTQVTGGSTLPAAASTVAVSTQKPVSPAATTLLPVTVSYAAFTYACVPSAQCVYTFNAPVNSQSFLATEESVIQGDKAQVTDLQTQINQYKTNVSLVFDPENSRVQCLQQQLQAAQVALNSLRDNISAIQANQQTAYATLVVLNQYINGLQANKNTCYYQQCMKPTPPPTTTPTTTKAPSTTISPCVGYCTNATLANNTASDSCTVQQKGAFCDCIGNLDGYQQCAFSGCSGNLALSAKAGPFWSPGYSSDGTSTPYPANSTCSWSFNGSYQTNSTGFIFSLDPTSTLVLDYGAGKTQITSNWRKLNAALLNYKQFTITLTSGVGVTPESKFAWNMNPA